MNELIMVGMLLASFGLTILFYYLDGQKALLAWISVATLIASIQATKLTSFFGIPLYLGNALYAATFLSTDILNEMYDAKTARKSIFYGIGGMLVASLFLGLTNLISSSGADVASEALKTVFNFQLRIAGGSIAAFLVSQFLDTCIFSKLKQKHGDKKLWLRNNLSTFVSQLIDTAIFVLISYYGTVSIPGLLSIAGAMLAVKIVSAIVDTPFMYLAKKIKTRE